MSLISAETRDSRRAGKRGEMGRTATPCYTPLYLATHPLHTRYTPATHLYTHCCTSSNTHTLHIALHIALPISRSATESRLDYTCVSMLCVPLQSAQGDLVGVLQVNISIYQLVY